MERIETLEPKTEINLSCYHCGDLCSDASIHINEKVFCCNGCKTVFELLEGNNLCSYYSIDDTPGSTRKYYIKKNYDYLTDEELKNKLIDFSDSKVTRITFDIPQMHCSSCIWILENLYKLNNGVLSSKVNFLQKKIFISYSESQTSLKEIVELLDSIGYEPQLNLEEKTNLKKKSEYKDLYYKIGIAGFAFGNIMLLSFPEYLSINITEHDTLKRIFAYLNIILSLPVFFYSSSDYFISAWKGLRKKIINIDVPLALGILVLFLRSIIDIVFLSGAGFLDSLAGLVFFLLVGKLFQNKTYETLNFERNYKSYFPIAVTTKVEGLETTIPVEKLTVGKRIFIRNNELIPADSILIKGSGNIDYSFVTGESVPVLVSNGEHVYAGGKQIGGAIEIETVKEVSQSYLTQLWNNSAFKNNYDENSNITSFSNIVSKYFTFGVISLAVAAALIWMPEASIAFNAFTAVLIVACPCALALSTPFTLGNTLRIFGKNNFYLKNTFIVEKLASINTIVFDKTGTITETGSSKVKFIGDALSNDELVYVKSVSRNSSHPLSQTIYSSIELGNILPVKIYNEITGKGIEAEIDSVKILLGSPSFVGVNDLANNNISARVFLSINNQVKGYFEISSKYRTGLNEIVEELSNNYELHVLSGDNESEKENLKLIFGNEKVLHFRQSPQEKLDYVSSLQRNKKVVLMIGDGLNDAGALAQSNIGISISDDTNNFSPACDGILDSKSFVKLQNFITFSKTSKNVIIASFILSLIYNIIGLSFAFQGLLSPLIAAILMPLSSISAVVFTTLSINLMARKRGLI